MTHFLNHYTLKYTPLSPLHIGADESYEPGNYVIDDEAGALYGFDSQAALAGLSENERQQLLAIVNGKPDDTMLTKVQAFFHNHREKLLAFAKQPIPTASGIKSLYQKRIGKTAQHEGNGRRIINKLEIERTFYNPVDATPLLPGSSIKGAIRTALLDAINDGERLKDRRERNQQFQQRLLAGNFHTDPMRLISIGDAAWQGSVDKPACQVRFAVNRKRKPVVKNGQLIKSQAETRELYQLLECIAPNHYQGFTGSLTLHDTQSIAQDDRKLPKQRFHWTIKEIAKACNGFYMELFWRELNAMKERHYLKSDWLNQIEQLMENDLLKRLNDGEAFMLRIGRHSGAEALTLGGVRSIKIMQGRGEKPKWEKEPKTWWLVADDIADHKSLLPFGWVLVEIDPQSHDTQLQNWLEKSHGDLTEWMLQQLDKQNRLKQQAELRLRKKQEQKEVERQQAEALRVKQQEEERRRASMTPEQLQIDALRQKLQQKQASNLREQIGGPLYGDMRELIKQTEAWPAGAKSELLDVAKDVLAFIGANGNKKAKELLKALQP
ncbi:RAMP superfamily CRISPR-associated protein [Methylomarinum sp. Ch1-1]|uniref:CRISPR system Cms protein Csm5 n=1 Tax=Methylomarinum roseum TaxID=3067653 RepID=A0AAU7NQ19_9GAMM|nr:RAMP superfamily CRISPR-associated protein [Methylomarinum sp. Ch1-1]MDP4521013.1 RAMP superfamily CRISPR-associated protein [Methylomarinum sp. Ch1-1]